MNRVVCALASLVAAVAVSSAARAQSCEPPIAQSLPNRPETAISFKNDTQFPIRIYWSDFHAVLKPMGKAVAPGETVGFKTYIDHRWYVTMTTPQGQFCEGPIAVVTRAKCAMSIAYGNGLELSGGDSCEYGPGD